MRILNTTLICLALVLAACSDDTNGEKDQGPGTPDAAGVDQKVTKPDAEIPDAFVPDLPPPDTTPWPDLGPDIMNPSSLWVEENIKPANKVQDILGKSATEIYAVGDKGLLLKYNGTSWSSMVNPDTGKANLYVVHGHPTSSYWYAAGAAIVLYISSGSTTWSKGSASTSSYYNQFRDMWGPTSGSYIVGVGEMPYSTTYTGMTYKSSTTPSSTWSGTYMTSSFQRYLYGIWGTGTSLRVAVGDQGTIMRCTNSTCSSSSYWSQMTSGTTTNLKDVYGFSASDIWACGFNGTVIHYDGSKWNDVSPKATDTYFQGIWGTSKSDIWAVGHPYFKPDESVWHYDGSAWKKVPPPRTSYLNAVWGVSTSQVWAVGNFNIIKLKKAP
jgi:hypothetical protein